MKLFYQAWAANDIYDWLLAGCAFAITLLAIALARSVLRRVLPRLASRTATGLDDSIVQAIDGTKLWLLTPAALYAGLSLVNLPPKLDRLATSIAIIALVAQVTVWVNRLIRASTQRQIERRRTGGEAITAISLMGFAARVLVWSMMILFALDQLGFDITALVAGLGIGGVAVALAVQNVLGDLFASISIVMDKPFVVGDFIVVDKDMGTVEYIGVKTTRVRALSGELIVFSNNELLKARIHNYKRMYERRIEFRIDVVYDTPPEQLEAIPGIMRRAIESQQKTRFDRAHLKECGAHAYVFEAVYIVLDPDYNLYMDIQQAINLAIVRDFQAEGIAFAYPTQTLFVNLPARPPENDAGGPQARDASLEGSASRHAA